MYQNWWRCSSHFNSPQTPVENGDAAHQSQPRDTESSEGSPGVVFWNVLLSEPHAALQSTQRALEAIQSRVAVMIQQHSHLQVELMDVQNTSDVPGDPEPR